MNQMLLTDFDYELPPELIAQEAAARRDASRLMTLERTGGAIGEIPFAGISELFRSGDLLVVNDTKVIPARLLGNKESGGRVEVFLVRRLDGEGEVWEAMIRASKPPRAGTVILFPGDMKCLVAGRGEGECWQVAFDCANGFVDWLEQYGMVPLPPYIRRSPDAADLERYQTVFAREAGAVAAPTAGLHFTPELMDAVRSKGVAIAPVTLHVGLGTFMPIRHEQLSDHRMHRERYVIPESTARMIRETRSRGGRVVALGTTTTRALEYAAGEDGSLPAGEGEADIFIVPGYRFKVVDALITNFHLPKSTLLMLVSAFAGKEHLFRAYAEAVRKRFRFYSYGDAMFIY